MKKTITISVKEYECLRGHLTEANKLLQKLEVAFGSEKAPEALPKKRTKADMMKLIDEREIAKRLRATKK